MGYWDFTIKCIYTETEPGYRTPPQRTESILNDFTENIANIKHLIEDGKTQPDQSSSQWMLLSRIDIQSRLLMLLSLLDILASQQLRPDSCIS